MYKHPSKSLVTRITAGIALVAALSLAAYGQSSVIRLKVVNVPADSGLLAEILPEFERTTGYRVEVDKRGDQVFDLARDGQADIVIAHYGHHGAEAFMSDDLALWPAAVFANQAALIGPPNDPAGIRGTQDAVEALRRIAQTNSRFLVNNAPTERYLGNLLREASGQPVGPWLIDSGLRDQTAIQAAARMGAYTLWGIVPFLRFKDTSQSTMEALVVDDSLFQRVMMAFIVDPAKIPGVNVAGAVALQKYLTLPATQARIRAFRYAGFNHQIFWPAARDNAGAFLAELETAPAAASDPVATGIQFDVPAARAGGTFRATFTGSNLGAQTYVDVRFRAPGSANEQIVTNWQQGTSGDHLIPIGTPPGVYTITGLRAHREAVSTSGSFIPVSAKLTVENR